MNNIDDLHKLYGLNISGFTNYVAIFAKFNGVIRGLCQCCGEEITTGYQECPYCGAYFLKQRYIGEYVEKEEVIPILKRIQKNCIKRFKLGLAWKLRKIIRKLKSGDATPYIEDGNKCNICGDKILTIYYFHPDVTSRGTVYAWWDMCFRTCFNGHSFDFEKIAYSKY